MTQRFLEKLASHVRSLSPSEQVVAQFVLQNPGAVLRMTLAALARETGVSQPTILRFVRAIGLSGFPELKIRTGQSLAAGTPLVHSAISREDSLETVVDKIFDSSVYMLNMVRESLDPNALATAIDLITRAKKVDFFACGVATPLALDAQMRFMRLGIPSTHNADVQMQRIEASTLVKGDVGVCLSFTGAVQDICKIAATAKSAGASVIAITRTATPLARLADVLLSVDTLTDQGDALTQNPRVAYDVLLDLISSTIALRKGYAGLERLRRVEKGAESGGVPDSSMGDM